MANGFMDVTKWKKWNVVSRKAQKALDNYNSEDDDDVSFEDVVDWNRRDVTDGFYNNMVDGGLYQLNDGKKFIVLGKGRGGDEIVELVNKFNIPELEYSINYNSYAGWYRFCQNEWVVVVLMDNELFFICEELGNLDIPEDMFGYFYENFEPGDNFDSDDIEVDEKVFKYRGKNYVSLVENPGTRDTFFNIDFFRDMKRIA
jgi:hypothetical protein